MNKQKKEVRLPAGRSENGGRKALMIGEVHSLRICVAHSEGYSVGIVNCSIVPLPSVCSDRERCRKNKRRSNPPAAVSPRTGTADTRKKIDTNRPPSLPLFENRSGDR